MQGRRVIALDGAADKLLALAIQPQIILGDFDSIHPDTRRHWGIMHDFNAMTESDKPYLGRHGVMIVPAKDQSQTDLVKAIRYCDEQHASDISIICASFGREDLHEANKQALAQNYRPNRPILLHSEQQSLRWAENESLILHGQAGDYCGFISTSPGYCNTQGLRYDGRGLSQSFCNRLEADSALIEICGAALLILPPQLKAQRF